MRLSGTRHFLNKRCCAATVSFALRRAVVPHSATSTSSCAAAAAALTCCRRCISVSTTTSTQQQQQRPQSRTSVLEMWNGKTDNAATTKRSSGKGLDFVLGSSRSSKRDAQLTTAAATAANTTAAEVKWSECERLDFLVRYHAPTAWGIREFVRENNLAIQCAPVSSSSNAVASGGGGDNNNATKQASSSPSIHGISLNCFAYHRKVVDPNSDKLLSAFLKRFSTCVQNLVVVCDSSTPPTPPSPSVAAASTSPVGGKTEEHQNAGIAAARGVDEEGHSVFDVSSASLCYKIASRLGGAVCEVTFEQVPVGDSDAAAPAPIKARGLCRAFYSTSRRFHYVVFAVVPEDEFLPSRDLLVHAITSVTETKASAAGSHF